MSVFQNSIERVVSLGSQYDKPKSLAMLAQARREHLSQFFTPLELVSFIWDLLTPSMVKASLTGEDSKISLFDNSVGSGRMFYYADPATHTLSGCDMHAESIQALMSASIDAGFESDLIESPMQGIWRTGQYSCGIINPPFSITLDDPDMPEFECNTHGIYGPKTRAISHVFALYQALKCCDVVAAVLPVSMISVIENSPKLSRRCHTIYKIPAKAFNSEGANVSTVVAVFDSGVSNLIRRVDVKSLSIAYPTPKLTMRNNRDLSGHLVARGIDDSEPVINRPITGDTRVMVKHNSRNIVLQYHCGLIEAKVENALLVEHVTAESGDSNHRYPVGVEYIGQGKLDIESYLATDNPLKSFLEFINQIKAAGAQPIVDPGLERYLEKRCKQVQVEVEPLRHSVFVQGNSVDTTESELIGTAKVDQTASDEWGSPFIGAGEEITFTNREDDKYTFSINDKEFIISTEGIRERFTLKSGNKASQWEVKHEGRVHAFPELARNASARAKALGLDKWLSWDYQWHDFIELCISSKGVINSWEMGLGKARCALALAMMGGKHNVVVVEAHLIEEMIVEIEGLDIPSDQWKVIEKESDTIDLCKINLISYTRLRMPLKGRSVKRTLGKQLRRRFHTVIGDEGHLLRNTKTQQSTAMRALSAKKRFILTGTPIANYPRDILPLIQYVGGDGTASQPYGLHKPFMRAINVKSMSYVPRGINEFSNNFVTMEWVTNEFAEELQEGAKREVPVINNVYQFREYLGPWVKRRLQQEPEVAKHVKIPVPSRMYHEIEWSIPHLSYYLTVCDEFKVWYEAYLNDCEYRGKSPNLMLIVLRLQAVRRAANVPFKQMKGLTSTYNPATSKEDFAVDRLINLAKAGHKTILYSAYPDVLKRIAKRLEAAGLTSPTVFHGGIPIKKRTKALNDEFRFGDSYWLLASFGVTQTGLNIPQADRVLVYDREWSASTEEQALRRVLRPQQVSDDVVFEYLHLKGSIDIYQDQMVAFKRDASCSGLDWGETLVEAEDFKHVDTILGEFCDKLAELYNLDNGFSAKEHIKNVA